MEKLLGESLNLFDSNKEYLKNIFPEVFCEGKIDFDKLRLLLGEDVEKSDERYDFSWNGKYDSIKMSQTPSNGTLRPDRESSKNFDDTDNLYIEGDNLEVLKLLQKSYFGKIKMIYIDPPYNTGKDFVYKDNFRDNIKNYKEVTNQNSSTNAESNGRYHTDWLNMMYPRLKLARNLMSDDGVIFISIDDNEVTNLKKICDEIFGEINFINNIVVKMSEVSGNKMAHTEKKLPKIKEYVLVYKKNEIKLNKIKLKKELWDEEYNIFLENFSREDKKIIDDVSNLEEKTDESLHLIDNILSKIETKSVKAKLQEFNILKSDELKWRLENSYRICRTATSTSVKRLIDEKKKINNNRFFSVLSNKDSIVYIAKADYSEDSNSPRVQVLFAEDNLSIGLGDLWMDITTTGLEFEGNVDYKNGKKPLKLIDRIVELSTNKGDLVIDFFSGSSTTAESVLRNNLKDNKHRKFIMVQFPENLNKILEESCVESKKSIKKSIDFLKSIDRPLILSEIGKERIRRAGEKILEENKDKEGIQNLDVGFKVFKLDDTNIKSWEYDEFNLEKTLLDAVDNIKEDRSEEDLLYEIMIKMGIELTASIEKVQINDKNIYVIGNKSLIAYLGKDINEEVVREIPKYKSEDSDTKVIFIDSAFLNDDALKKNTIKNLEQFGIKDVRSI
ncbi:MAG: site-specific DNA-methyltransferase [Peptostreptococcaceae bacterium]